MRLCRRFGPDPAPAFALNRHIVARRCSFAADPVQNQIGDRVGEAVQAAIDSHLGEADP